MAMHLSEVNVAVFATVKANMQAIVKKGYGELGTCIKAKQLQ